MKWGTFPTAFMSMTVHKFYLSFPPLFLSDCLGYFLGLDGIDDRHSVGGHRKDPNDGGVCRRHSSRTSALRPLAFASETM